MLLFFKGPSSDPVKFYFLVPVSVTFYFLVTVSVPMAGIVTVTSSQGRREELRAGGGYFQKWEKDVI